MDPKQRTFSIWYIVIALWVVMLLQFFVPSLFNPTEIPYSEFKEAVVSGKVAEVSISSSVIRGRMKTEEGNDHLAFDTVRVDDPDLVRELQAHDVKITGG